MPWQCLGCATINDDRSDRCKCGLQRTGPTGTAPATVGAGAQSGIGAPAEPAEDVAKAPEDAETQDAVEAVYAYAAELMKEGQSPQQIESALVAQGLDQEDASAVVVGLTEALRDARKAAGRKNMIYGALWCIGGTIVTVGSLSAAGKGGGTYVVAWGAIIFGAIQFFRGLHMLSTSS